MTQANKNHGEKVEASDENSEGWDHGRAHSTFESSERTTFTHGMFPINYI